MHFSLPAKYENFIEAFVTIIPNINNINDNMHYTFIW